ncbi:GlxA family transcriptional regulator [Pseudomonas sp. SDO528_S397]
MGFAALSVFEIANNHTGKPLYQVSVLSETGGPIRSSMGVHIHSHAFDDSPYDTLLFGSGVGAPLGVVEFARKASGRVPRIASICVGAFVLARAGLLDGRRATTHWVYTAKLQSQFPAIKVEEDRIFIHDGPLWTSAGMSAGIDLALAMVEEDHGRDLATIVAKKLVLYHRRAGGQSQFSVMQELAPKSDRIQAVLAYARKNLRLALSVPLLAEVAHLSPRQFSRAFLAETGQSPAKAIERLRVEAARLLLEEGHHAMDYVVQHTGFVDRERMRRSFLRAFGHPPQTIRRNARGD